MTRQARQRMEGVTSVGKAPGRHYRSAISITELATMFPDEEAAREWLTRTRWPDGLHCPRCGSDDVQEFAKHPTMNHRCRTCKRYFSVRTGTAIEGSNLPLRTWVLAFYLMVTSVKSVSSLKLHRDLKISQKSAWHLAHRIRKAFQSDVELLEGPVEADETFFGGKERNRHARKKLRAGRGTAGKTAVVGVKDRATGEVRAEVVPRTDAPTLQGFVIDNVSPAATVFSDDNLAYRGLPFEHETVKHSVGEYVHHQAHTNGLESFWSMLKRGFHGTFHHMSPKHLHRYVSEFSSRHGMRARAFDTERMMQTTFRALIGQRLKYDDLTSGPPAYPDRRKVLK